MKLLTTLRIDKWLKVARLYKKREDASDAVENGLVKLNGQRVKPSRNIVIGDVITVKIDHRYQDLTVKQITTQSLSATLAKELYETENLPPTIAEIEQLMDAQIKQSRADWRKTHNNKKARREINKKKYEGNFDEGE